MVYIKKIKGNNLHLIREIQIKDLFGHYNYSLKIPSIERNALSTVGILYGDNGSGKTTILKLLFHLLSPNIDRGHRSKISNIPFSKISVLFSDKVIITAGRRGNMLTGSFTVELKKPNQSPLKAKFEATGGRGIKRYTKEGIDLYNEIEKLGLSIFFLTDLRTLESNEFEQVPEEPEFIEKWDREMKKRYRFDVNDRRDSTLNQSLEQTTTLIHRSLIEASSRGDVEAQSIYANIVENIDNLTFRPAIDTFTPINKLKKELKELEKRSTVFTELGLTSKINIRSFYKGLNKTTKKSLPFVERVVRSFIDGQLARLNALEKLKVMLVRFLSQINSFFVDKKIKIKISEGISIISDYGENLKTEMLSSGEKQLLLLLLNILIAGETASLFIIDEPEISLNVKWQRKLIDALVDITQGSQCQFLFATHSIEFLTKHRNQVIKLENI